MFWWSLVFVASFDSLYLQYSYCISSFPIFFSFFPFLFSFPSISPFTFLLSFLPFIYPSIFPSFPTFFHPSFLPFLLIVFINIFDHIFNICLFNPYFNCSIFMWCFTFFLGIFAPVSKLSKGELTPDSRSSSLPVPTIRLPQSHSASLSKTTSQTTSRTNSRSASPVSLIDAHEAEIAETFEVTIASWKNTRRFDLDINVLWVFLQWFITRSWSNLCFYWK